MARRGRQGFNRQVSRAAFEDEAAFNRFEEEFKRFLDEIGFERAIRGSERGPHPPGELLELFARGALAPRIDPSLEEKLAAYLPRHILYCEDCGHLYPALYKDATEDD